jgi:hypothetical protein
MLRGSAKQILLILYLIHSFLRLNLIFSWQVVDTVLAKIYAKAEKTKELYALIQEPHAIVLTEMESVLKQTGQYNALCMLYKQTGDDENLLQVWSRYVVVPSALLSSHILIRLVEGEWTDDDIENPIEDMLNLLTTSKSRALIQKWGLWLTRRDPERGIRVNNPTCIPKRYLTSRSF